ncbi:MAG: sialidase family protein, partial [Candidatus Dormibacterales bacterium]
RLPAVGRAPARGPARTRTRSLTLGPGVGPDVLVSDPSTPFVYSETAAAADPANPASLFAGSNVIYPQLQDYMAASSSGDAGATWTPHRGPPGHLAYTSDPSAVYDATGGSLYYSYIGIDAQAVNTDLELGTSHDGGTTWTSVVDPGAVCPDKPLMAVDDVPGGDFPGRVYVAYDQNLAPRGGRCPASAADQPVFLDYTDDGGQTWTSRVVYDNPTHTGAGIGAFPVVAPDHDVYVAWDDYGDSDTGEVVIARSTDYGQHFSSPAVIAPTSAGFGVALPGYAVDAGQGIRTVGPMPALAVDPTSGVLYAAWADTSATSPRMHIYLSSSTDGGATWSKPARIDTGNPNDGWQPALAVDGGDGRSPHAVTLAWYDRRDDPGNRLYRVYYAQSLDGGRSFSPEEAVSDVQSDPTLDVNGTGDYMEMADAAGVAHPVWSDTRNGRNQIFTAAVTESQVPAASPPDHRVYLAEGTTRPGFQEYLTLENPTGKSVPATIAYEFSEGSPALQEPPVTLAPHSRFTENVNSDVGPGRDVSTIVDSPSPDLLVERPIYFDACILGTCVSGGDDAKGAQPAYSWDFAEGTTRPGFQEFLTFLNPDPAAVAATVRWGYGPGQTGPASTGVQLQPGRTTLTVAGLVGAGKDVSAAVTAAAPIVVERPIYFRACVPVCMSGGDDAPGAQPQATWDFAEGTTRPGFDEYLTVLNTGASTEQVTASYFFSQGQSLFRQVGVPAGGRVTILVNGVAGNGRDVSVQVVQQTPFAEPAAIVVERPMYFNACVGPGVCAAGGDVVAGAASDWPQWGFAEGTTRPGFTEYLTLENPGFTDALVDVKYLTSQGSTITAAPVLVPAGGRATIRAGDGVPAGLDVSAVLGVDARTPGAEVVAERPLYFSTCAVGVCADGGSDAVGFPLYPG